MPVEPAPTPWRLPDPRDAQPGVDIVAVGADLAPGTVLAGYRAGLFPMQIDDGRLGWWSPDPRGVLPLDGLRVSRSLRASARRFTVTVDQRFPVVMHACALERPGPTWITDEFVAAYSELHQLGWAHSIEVWSASGELAGGLYGLEIGGLFAGESMFYWQRDASKVALVHLVERLRAAGGTRLLDVQWRTPHLASLGVVEVARPEYLARLADALATPPAF